MTQKYLLAAVLLCLLTEKVLLISGQQFDSTSPEVQTPIPIEPYDVVKPTLQPQLVYAMNTDLYDTSTAQTTILPTTTDISTDYTTQDNVGVVPQGGNWFNSLFGQNGNGPSLVVEVNDATNDASLKIINLPLVRYTKNGTVLETKVPTTLSSTTTTSPSHTPKSRRKRDLDFEIHDKSVIRALIYALQRIEHKSVDFLLANINSVEINVELHDNDDFKDDRKRRSISYQSKLELKQTQKLPRSSNMQKRRTRDVEFEIDDMSVIEAIIEALQRIDHQRADFMQRNINRLEISVEVEND